MTNLKRLGGAVVLTLALGLSAFADCPAPGIMQGPPCLPAAQTVPDDPTAPRIMNSPPASYSVDLISVAEITLKSFSLF